MRKEFLSYLLVPREQLATCLVLVCTVLTAAQNASQPKFTVKPLTLPGSSGLVVLDYIAYDAVSHRVWVPAGNTGNVDVIDTTNDNVVGIAGFATGQVEFRGKPRVMGPSSVSVGDGVVFIGNRANSQICMGACNQDLRRFAAQTFETCRQNPLAGLCRRLRSR